MSNKFWKVPTFNGSFAIISRECNSQQNIQFAFFEDTKKNVSYQWERDWAGDWETVIGTFSNQRMAEGMKMTKFKIVTKKSDMDTKKESKQEPIPRWERKCLYDRKSLLRQTMFWNRFVLLFVNGYWILFVSKIFSCFCFFNCYLFKLYNKIEIVLYSIIKLGWDKIILTQSKEESFKFKFPPFTRKQCAIKFCNCIFICIGFTLKI